MGASEDRHRLAGRLLSASVVYAVALFGTKALSLLLLPLFTRYLSPADYGRIALSDNIAALVAILFGFGLDQPLRRLYFEYVDDPRALARYVSTVLRFAITITASVLFIALLAGPRLLTLVAPHFAVSFFPYVALSLCTAAALSLLGYRQALYQTESRPRAYSLLAVVLALLTACSTVGFVVVAKWGAVGMLSGKLLATAISMAIALFLLRNWLNAGWELRFLRESLVLALPLILYQFSVLGLEMGDRLILQHYRGVSEVGLYSFAYVFGMAMWLVVYSVWQAWAPIFYDLARLDTERDRLGRISAALIVMLTAIGILGSVVAQDFIALIFDQRYQPAGHLVPLILGAYVFHGIFGLFQLPALQARKVSMLLVVTTTAFAANVALNLLFDPRWGMYGAAYATLAAYGLEALLMVVLSQKAYPLPLSWKRLFIAVSTLGTVLILTQAPIPGLWHQLVLASALSLAYVALWLAGGKDIVQAAHLIWQRRTVSR